MIRAYVRLSILPLLLFTSQIFGSVLTRDERVKTVVKDLETLLHDDTTSLRQEFKTVLDKDTYQNFQGVFQNPVELSPSKIVNFLLRDKPPEGGKNGTFTFYGRRLGFMTGSTKTVIKLRARFYMEVMSDGSVNLAKAIEDRAFLELKIKHPKEDIEGLVNKFRIELSPEDLVELFALDATKEDFADRLRDIEKRALEFRYNSSRTELIPHFFEAIRTLSEIDPHFVNPELGIYYERAAYQVFEEPYCLNDSNHTTIEKKIDYQITVDHNICGYFKMPIFQLPFSFLNYFRSLNPEDGVPYFTNSTAVEIKLPLEVGSLRPAEWSDLHSFLHSTFIQKLGERSYMNQFFKPNRGKASYLRKLALAVSED